ncbi:hypothetical protein COCNU_03G000440 [Cocos nucifera]|uniref:Uncharacterized protein n=1 Tax=Cocos nucifera TaxID=13894 RepID=A0A8K0MY08_COCNU|nr:hypothetical protein COCNU_03G000440 [Cocos nucifera]
MPARRMTTVQVASLNWVQESGPAGSGYEIGPYTNGSPPTVDRRAIFKHSQRLGTEGVMRHDLVGDLRVHNGGEGMFYKPSSPDGRAIVVFERGTQVDLEDDLFASLDGDPLEVTCLQQLPPPSSFFQIFPIGSSRMDVDGTNEPDSPKTRRSSCLKAVGAVKEVTSRLLPARRKKKGAKDALPKLDPIKPLGSLPQQLLLEWGRACGFSFSDEVANEIVQTLLELEAAKAAVNTV